MLTKFLLSGVRSSDSESLGFGIYNSWSVIVLFYLLFTIYLYLSLTVICFNSLGVVVFLDDVWFAILGVGTFICFDPDLERIFGDTTFEVKVWAKFGCTSDLQRISFSLD